MAEESAVKEKPASRRISARRVEAEARMSFMVSPGFPEGKNTIERARRQPVLWCREEADDGDGRAGRKSGGEPPHSKLDDDRFLVFAEDAAEGVGDFADGGVGFDGGENGGEEIFSGGGAALEFGEGGFGAGGIALGAEGVQAGDLRALDFGVDAERGNSARMVSFRWGDE